MGIKRFYEGSFRKSSAELAVNSEQSIRKTADGLGIKATRLYGWVDRYYLRAKLAAKGLDADAEIKLLKKGL